MNTAIFQKRYIMGLFLTLIWVLMMGLANVKPDWSAGLLALGFIMVYCVIISVAMLHHKRQEMKRNKHGLPEIPAAPAVWPKVSIIIPAHNEVNVIAHSVERMMSLDYPDYDVLVMDDRSTDGTTEAVQQLQAHWQQKRDAGETPVQLKCHTRPAEATPGKSAVLNDALTLCDGEILAVFDADATVRPEFLRRLVPFLGDARVGAAQARKMIANADDNILTMCQNYEYALDAQFQHGRDSIRGAAELRGNGFVVKRQAVEDVGGWNERSVTDDLDLSTKLHLGGWDIRFAPQVLVFEEGIPHLKPLIMQRIRWAEGTFSRYVDYGWQILTSPRTSWRSRLDMMAYFVEYCFPLWMVSDYLVVAVLWMMGDVTSYHMWSTVALFPLLAVFFMGSIFVSIMRFFRPGLFNAIGGAVITGLFMSFIWVPVVWGCCWKVILRPPRERPKWHKTEHYGSPSIELPPLQESL